MPADFVTVIGPGAAAAYLTLPDAPRVPVLVLAACVRPGPRVTYEIAWLAEGGTRCRDEVEACELTTDDAPAVPVLFRPAV